MDPNYDSAISGLGVFSECLSCNSVGRNLSFLSTAHEIEKMIKNQYQRIGFEENYRKVKFL